MMDVNGLQSQAASHLTLGRQGSKGGVEDVPFDLHPLLSAAKDGALQVCLVENRLAEYRRVS